MRHATSIRLLFLLLCLFLHLSSCSNENKIRSHSPIVGIALCNSNAPFIEMVYTSIEENLSNDITAIILDSQKSTYLQVKQIEELIAKDVDILVVKAMNKHISEIALNIAKENNIPIILFNKNLIITNINNYPKAYCVGTSSAQAGNLQGEAIKRVWDKYPESEKNKKNKLGYIILQSNIMAQTALQTESAIRHAMQLGIEMEQVRPTYLCNGDRDAAEVAVESALREGIEDVQFIISTNDLMALGAIDALQKIGYNLKNGSIDKYIPVIGGESSPEIIKALQDKRMTATVKYNGVETGRVIAQLIKNILSGNEYLDNLEYSWEKEGKVIYIPPSLVTGED